MIDAKLYAPDREAGKQARTITKTTGECLWSSCSWPPVIPPPGIGNGFVGPGDTLVCTVTVQVQTGATKLTAYGFFDYTPGVGDDLDPGGHSMIFQIDFSATTSIILSNPFGNVRYQRSNAPTLDFVTPGSHTLTLYYGAATTGVGFDILWAATLQICA